MSTASVESYSSRVSGKDKLHRNRSSGGTSVHISKCLCIPAHQHTVCFSYKRLSIQAKRCWSGKMLLGIVMGCVVRAVVVQGETGNLVGFI